MTAAVAATPFPSPAATRPLPAAGPIAATAANPSRRTDRRRRRYTETSDFLKLTARLIRRAGARVATADMAELEQLLELRHVLDEAIADAVTGVRDSGGYSWKAVGDAAGITRQSAHERWSTKG